MKDFLQHIGNAYNKMCAAMSKHGILIGIIVALVIVLVYSALIHPININSIVEKAFEKEKQEILSETEKAVNLAVEKRINADNVIGNMMVHLTEKFEPIQRVLLLEGHNGTKTFGNADLIFMTCTMEMLTDNSRNMSYVADDLQRQIKYNLLGQFTNTLKYKKYFYQPDISMCSHNEHRLFQKLKASGDKEVILYPFLDSNDIIQLLLVITGVNLPVDDIIYYIDEHKKVIEDCLM